MVQACRSLGRAVYEMREDGMNNFFYGAVFGAPLVIMALKEIGWWL